VSSDLADAVSLVTWDFAPLLEDDCREKAWIGFTTISAAEVTMPVPVAAKDDAVAVTGSHLRLSMLIGLLSYLGAVSISFRLEASSPLTSSDRPI
jgi:hypothetical protein